MKCVCRSLVDMMPEAASVNVRPSPQPRGVRVLGAILAFAIKESPSWIELDTTGWIFMIAGVVGIVLTSWYSKHQKRVHKEVHDRYQANRIARRQAIKRNDARRAAETEQAETRPTEN